MHERGFTLCVVSLSPMGRAVQQPVYASFTPDIIGSSTDVSSDP